MQSLFALPISQVTHVESMYQSWGEGLLAQEKSMKCNVPQHLLHIPAMKSLARTSHFATSFPIYFISLPESERAVQFKKDFSSFSPRIYHVLGVNGRNSTELDTISASHIDLFAKVQRGVLGCAFSHLRAIRAAYKSNETVAIIMEDDTTPYLFPWWRMSIEEYVASLPAGWQASQLQFFGLGKIAEPFTTAFVKNMFYSTGTYVIHRRGMRRVLEFYGGLEDEKFDLALMSRKCRPMTSDDCLLGFTPSKKLASWVNGSSLLTELTRASTPFFISRDAPSTIRPRSLTKQFCTDIENSLSQYYWEFGQDQPTTQTVTTGINSLLARPRLAATTVQLMKSVNNKMPWRRFVYSINTGRSGSKYLSQIFNSVENTFAVHEPQPAFSLQTRTLQSTYETRTQTAFRVFEKLMGQSKHKPVYVETNPNFKSLLWDVVLNELSENYRVDVVIIRRHIPAVMKSLYQLGWFSTNRNAYEWMETCNSVNSYVRSLVENDRQQDAFDNLMSYIVNTEGFAQFFKNVSRSNVNVVIHEYRSESIYTKKGVLQLIRDLNLQPTALTHKLAGEPLDKHTTKQKNAVKVTLAECELRARQYIAKAAEKDIHLPDLPHMKPWNDTHV